MDGAAVAAGLVDVVVEEEEEAAAGFLGFSHDGVLSLSSAGADESDDAACVDADDCVSVEVVLSTGFLAAAGFFALFSVCVFC